MGEKLADGDFVGASEIGEKFGDFVVEGKFILLDEGEDRGGGELLGDGAYGVASVLVSGAVRGDGGVAKGFGVDEGAVVDDRYGDAGSAAIGEHLGDFLFFGVVEAGGGGGAAGLGEGARVEKRRGEDEGEREEERTRRSEVRVGLIHFENCRGAFRVLVVNCFIDLTRVA